MRVADQESKVLAAVRKGVPPTSLLIALLIILPMGCVPRRPGALAGAGPVSSRVVAVWRTVLVPPQEMAPAENDSLLMQATPPGGCEVGVIPGSSPESFLARWLPAGERGTMRRFMVRLRDGGAAQETLLRNARAHLPGIVAMIKEYDIPQELAYLPLVESGFDQFAVSPAGAAGLWQLMPDTARRFGLKVSASADERFDTRKATAAAVAYLAALYRRFHDWPLALAAYNCGEGAMARALDTAGAASLAEITALCRRKNAVTGLLPAQTLDFVPNFVGAVRFMTDVAADREHPASGGLDVKGRKPPLGAGSNQPSVAMIP